MKIHTLTYVGLYDDDSIATDTRIALSYEEACKQRHELYLDHGQPEEPDSELAEEEWTFELEEGDKIVEVTHQVPDLDVLKAVHYHLKSIAARPLLVKAMEAYIKEIES